MATFKIGDRVRALPHARPVKVRGLVGAIIAHASGAEWRGEFLTWRVHFDGLNDWQAMTPSEITPLIDPKADEFIESVKKWEPLHEEPKVGITFAELREHALRWLGEKS